MSILNILVRDKKFFLTAEIHKGHWNQSQRNKYMDSIVISGIYCETGFFKSLLNLPLRLRCFLVMCKSVITY